MKQMRFLDNVRTPDAWKQEALSRAAEEHGRPQLKRWHITGIAAVTAVLMVSIGLIPALFGDRAVNTRIGMEDSTAEEEVTGAQDTTILSDMKAHQEIIDRVTADYDVVETVTVLDGERMPDGSILIAAAREKYKMGNGILCINVPKIHEPYSEKAADVPSFGDRVCVGFKRVRGADLVEIEVKNTINGREYTAKQATGAADADFYMPFGKWTDELFDNVLTSACAATGHTADDLGEDTKEMVRCYYSNAERVKPRYDCDTKSIVDKLVLDARKTLFDERYTSNGMPSQLFVTAIVNMDYGDFSTALTEKDGEYILKLGKHTGKLDISCSTEVDILNVELVPDNVSDTVYLLVNLADKEGTGNIRGVIGFDITLEDGSSTKTITPDTSKCIPIHVEDNEFDMNVDVLNIYFPYEDDVDDDEMNRFYRFEFKLTPKDDTDLSKLTISDVPGFPERTILEIPGQGKYAVSVQCAARKEKIYLLADKPEVGENGELILDLMVTYEGATVEILPANFTFGKVDGSGELSEDCVVTFGEDGQPAENENTDMTGAEVWNEDAAVNGMDDLGLIIEPEQNVTLRRMDMNGKTHYAVVYLLKVSTADGSDITSVVRKKNGGDGEKLTVNGKTVYIRELSGARLYTVEEYVNDISGQLKGIFAEVLVEYDEYPDIKDVSAVFGFGKTPEETGEENSIAFNGKKAMV